MYRLSNKVIGYINLLTLISSLPIIGAAIWFTCCSSFSCESSFKTLLLIIGFLVLLVSLAGLIGSCFNVAWVLWVYLFTMFVIIMVLLCVTAFGFDVTEGGGGTKVEGRVYAEYRLEDYSGWLRGRVSQDNYWEAAKACVVSSQACKELATWTPVDYLQKDLTPVQSGCCKPPTSCMYTASATTMKQDEDCYRWSNEADILCYGCDSCKAGVLEQVRRNWHKLSVFNVVLLSFLIVVYSIGCCAFHNACRDELSPYGRSHLSKVNPRWDYCL